LSFLEIQTRTPWGRTLQSFCEWCQPRPGWRTLDVGCGPGLLPALLGQQGCRAFGVDLADGMLSAHLHPSLVQAQAQALPFPPRSFNLVTATNLLFLLDDPQSILGEMARLLRQDGQIAVLNPSERMSIAAATALADQRELQGLDRYSLLDWAARAEARNRWDHAGLAALFDHAGLKLEQSMLKIGPGLARFARGKPQDSTEG